MNRLKKEHRKNIDKKLLFRLRLYFVIAIILLGIIAEEILFNKVTVILALSGLLAGIFIGIIVARMFLLSWDKDAQKVISRLDFAGVIILIIYIIFAVLREKIIGQFVQANYVTGTSLSLVAGIMIGRVFGTGHKIIEVLKEQNLFKL